MSVSLIKRGLELFNADFKDESKCIKKQQPTPSTAKVMELVSTNRQGVAKQVKRLQGRLGPGRSKATVKDRRIQSAVEEFRKKQKKSNMSDNLQYFMETGYKATGSDAMKIQRYNSGRQSRNKPDQPKKAVKKPESVFTEEEFQQFQKEYFGRIDKESN
ncbi:unnamed protein product [Tetraodon nigroviridis]|uniref:Active regulator of SIRT1 n=1 Tax=Tetraodon nigroviridis TaxID=99883 RepID=Q4RGF0_TETNG|nr:unnamed protein product [Tetraodon nigroviridis]